MIDQRSPSKGPRTWLPWVTGLYAIVLFTGTHIPPRVAEEWSPSVSISDKMLHFSAYLGLAALLTCSLGLRRKLGQRDLALILGLVSFLGAVDEWTQSLPGIHRNTELLDWVADTSGALCGVAIAALVLSKLRSRPEMAEAAARS